MDSVHETMERIYRLMEKHGPEMAGIAGMPLEKPRQPRAFAPRMTYPPEVKKRALRALAHGKPPRRVAAELKLPVSTVCKWSKQAGYKWPQFQRYKPHPQKATALALLAAGTSLTLVAHQLRLSINTVAAWKYQLRRQQEEERAEAAAS